MKSASITSEIGGAGEPYADGYAIRVIMRLEMREIMRNAPEY